MALKKKKAAKKKLTKLPKKGKLGRPKKTEQLTMKGMDAPKKEEKANPKMRGPWLAATNEILKNERFQFKMRFVREVFEDSSKFANLSEFINKYRDKSVMARAQVRPLTKQQLLVINKIEQGLIPSANGARELNVSHTHMYTLIGRSHVFKAQNK